MIRWEGPYNFCCSVYMWQCSHMSSVLVLLIGLVILGKRSLTQWLWHSEGDNTDFPMMTLLVLPQIQSIPNTYKLFEYIYLNLFYDRKQNLGSCILSITFNKVYSSIIGEFSVMIPFMRHQVNVFSYRSQKIIKIAIKTYILLFIYPPFQKISM